MSAEKILATLERLFARIAHLTIRRKPNVRLAAKARRCFRIFQTKRSPTTRTKMAVSVANAVTPAVDSVGRRILRVLIARRVSVAQARRALRLRMLAAGGPKMLRKTMIAIKLMTNSRIIA